jgi:hypothetical protein
VVGKSQIQVAIPIKIGYCNIIRYVACKKRRTACRCKVALAITQKDRNAAICFAGNGKIRKLVLIEIRYFHAPGRITNLYSEAVRRSNNFR